MSVPYLDEVIIEPDGIGITLYGGARVYKKPGTGLITRLAAGNVRMQVENNAGSILGTYWDSGNLPVSTFMQGVLDDADAATARTTLGAQAQVYKTVFQTANGGSNAGWVRLGTLTGDNQSRWEIRVTGKQGWNDQNFPGQAILHGSTNYVGSDTGQIAAGCKWIESTGSSTVATEFALVRQAGYPTAKFDLYVLLDSAFVGWLVEVTTMGGSGWVTNVAYNQANPGTGSNVFKPTRYVAWDSSWVASPIGGTGTVGAIPKFSATTTLANSLLSDTGTEIRQASGIHRLYNPNLTDFAVAFTRGTAAAPDANSAFVMRMDGYLEWGAGGGSSRDTNLYRAGANLLKTDDVFEANAVRGTANSTPTTSANSLWSTAPVLANRASTSGTTTVAGIGFHNQGVNAALLYYDPSVSKFMYNRHSGGPLLTLVDSESLDSAATNYGSTFEGASDPFHATQRYTDFDKRGGVRTWHGIGPFSGSEEWYNVVDITHRNGVGDGASGYGGLLAWGMTANTTRMAFASRSVTGAYSWTEVWTKADISDANMPRLNGTNAWTGTNTFYGDLKIRGTGFDMRSGSGDSGGFFAKENTGTSEPYNGVAFSYNGTQTRVSLGVHGDPSALPNEGFYVDSNVEGAYPLVRMRGQDVEVRANAGGTLGIRRVSRFSFNEDFHAVTSSNLTMTKLRAVIDSTTYREVTLPDPVDHDLAVIMVRTDSSGTKHRIYPPSGTEIRWTDYSGTSRTSAASGVPSGSACRVSQGMYWFVSDGTYWYLMSPASTT